MGHFQWSPNFYIVFVAPPGIISKSTTANIGMSLLREVPGIFFGPNVATWQSLLTSLAGSTESFELPDHTLLPMSSISIVASEFGSFLNPNDREMVDVLVDLWDGRSGAFEKWTKSSGNDRIINPWINIIACTTPAWIAGNFPEYMIGGGFSSRTIFVYGEKKRRLIAYPQFEQQENQEELREQLIHDLEYISVNLVGEFKLSPEALAFGRQWYEELYEKNKDLLATERFAGYVARKQTHLHKLAMVLSASYKDELLITAEDLINANALLANIESMMDQVFAQINAPEARSANTVVNLVRQVRRIEQNEAFKRLFNAMSLDHFKQAVEAGVESGQIVRMNQNGRAILVDATGILQQQAPPASPT